jgi:hypothetical protein
VGRGKVANLDYEQSQIYLMEVEILSPYRHIEPGQTTSFQIEWGACRCPGPILDVTEGGCTGEKFLAKRDGETVRIRGGFGVFDEGMLRLEWVDQAGQAIDSLNLGAVSPRNFISLNQQYSAPPEASQVQLVVIVNGKQLLLAQTGII